MRRIPLALALVGAVAVTGCMGGSKAPATTTDSSVQKGEIGNFYFVNLFTPPVGGVVTSSIGGINCGASGATAGAIPAPVTSGVATSGRQGDAVCSTAYPCSCTPVDPCQVAQGWTYNYYGTSNACGQAQINWGDSVVLTAAAQGTNAFIGWAGDCSGSAATCTLTAGADKNVVAIFGPAGGGHVNFLDPAVHIPAYIQFNTSPAFALKCNTCHGENLLGQGIAPSCGTCHAVPTKSGPPPLFTKTGLVAAIVSITPPATSPTVITFTLKDDAGKVVDVTGVGVTGGSGKNHPIELRTALMNFDTDTAGNVLPFKSSTNGNGNTTTIWPLITSMTITSGTLPATGVATYPDGSLSQNSGATLCTQAAKCACTAASPCAYSGKVGTQLGVACTATNPCVCTAGNPCGPTLPTANAAGALTLNASTGLYTYTFASSPYPASTLTANYAATQEFFLQAVRKENVTKNPNVAPFAKDPEGVDQTYTVYVGVDDGTALTAQNVSLPAFKIVTGGASVTPATNRQIVNSAACAACHDGFQAKSSVANTFHSGARIGGDYCAVCHYEGRSSGTADAKVFVHRIHAAREMELATSIWFHGIGATYPQDIRNCDACHISSAPQANQWNTRPTIMACFSCHDTAGTLPLTSASIMHPAGATVAKTDADCATCHDSANIISKHLAVAPPAADNCLTLKNATGCNANTNAAFLAAAGQVPSGAAVFTWEIGTVSTYTDGAVQRPQMTFKIKINGVDRAFDAITTTQLELYNGVIGSPSLYWVWAQPQDGIATPADFNASASVYLRNLWNGLVTGTTATISGPDASGFYTAKLTGVVIPTNATLLTGGVGYSYNNTSSLPLTQTTMSAFPTTTVTGITSGKVNNVACTTGAPCTALTGGLIVPTTNVWKAGSAYTARRVVVDNAKCNACHANLGVAPTFHAGQRNDAPSCSWCHNPNRASSGWSANVSTFIHGIHAAEKRTVGFNWHAACAFGSTWDNTTMQCKNGSVVTEPSIWYPEVEYPGTATNCTQCHTAGGYDFSANAAVVKNLLWSTVATGTFTSGNAMSNSPYVIQDNVTSYGAGYGIATATGVITAATGASLVNSPISAACFSCHDTAAAASHMKLNGGSIYNTRSAAFANGTGTASETCLDCHGLGKSAAIKDVHRVK